MFSHFLPGTLVGLLALASTALFGYWTLYLGPAAPEATGTPAPWRAAALTSNPYGALLDPGPVAEPAPAPPVPSAPDLASLEPNRLAPSVLPPEPKSAAPIAEAPRFGAPAPLPIPRPAELAERPSPSPAEGRRLAQQNRRPVAALPDDRPFFDKLFALFQPEPVVAPAVPASSAPALGRNGGARASAGYDRWTAVYDIASRTVHLPNGRRLEAHSGLGDKLDDPRYVHVKMRGATPPNVYELRPREQLFHGVQALRLIPVGNGDLYGRDGLLAHTYMLGPNGDSNGCVSIRDYNAFLQAYQNGEIKRLVVVASLN